MMIKFSKYNLSSVISIFIIGVFNQCDTYNFTENIELKDLSQKYHSEYDTQVKSPLYIYVFVEGESDGNCEIRIHPYNQKRKNHPYYRKHPMEFGNSDIRRFPIKKGRVNISYKEDWYSTALVVDYFSENAQKGNLKIKIGIN